MANPKDVDDVARVLRNNHLTTTGVVGVPWDSMKPSEQVMWLERAKQVLALSEAMDAEGDG